MIAIGPPVEVSPIISNASRLGRDLRVYRFHELPEDHQRGETVHPTTVKGEQAEIAFVRRLMCG